MNFCSAPVPCDRGPIYAETQMGRFPVEPWNTVTVFLFLIIAFIWGKRIRRTWKNERLLTTAVVLLFVGTIGGGMYHACRCENLWLSLDILPIVSLAGIGAGYLWLELIRCGKGAFSKGAIFTITFVLLDLILRSFLPRQVVISLFYVALAVAVLTPAFLLSSVRNGAGRRELIVTVSLFSAAIFFRIIDFQSQTREIFPMGTHFLWHILGACCAHFMLCFVVAIRNGDLRADKAL